MTEQWIASHDGSIVTTAGVTRGELERYSPIEVRLPHGTDRIVISRLIAAAPDLLAACRAVIDPTVHPESAVIMITDAIAKATGGNDGV